MKLNIKHMIAAFTFLGMVGCDKNFEEFDIVGGGAPAATIIFGLTFATLLTLFVTPALYAMFYKIKSNSKYASYEKN